MELATTDVSAAFGSLPSTWTIVKIKNLGEIRTGPFGTLLKAEEYSGAEGVPLISVREVGHGSLRVGDHTPLVPATVVARLPQYVLRAGDLVFGRKGAVDRSAIVLPSQAGWFLGSDGIRLRPSKSLVPEYLALQFQTARVKSWLLQNATGTTMASLNQKVLGEVPVPIPPLAEQRAIAEALGDVDALIGALAKLIAKKRDIKQAAMQQLLTGRTRLPGFSGEWNEYRLGELSRIATGSTPPGHLTNNYGNEYLFVSPVDLGESKYILRTEKQLSREGFARCRSFPKASILFVCIGSTIGKIGISQTELTSNQQINAIFPSGSFSSEYLYYVLLLDAPNIKALASEQAVPIINKTQFAATFVRLPQLSEQNAIASVLSDIDAEIFSLQARLAKTRDIKQGMMQELLTGRTRLV